MMNKDIAEILNKHGVVACSESKAMQQYVKQHREELNFLVFVDVFNIGYIEGKEQNEQEERQVLSMKPINTYKKCLCCGSKYQATAERKKCLCGGHLYLIGTVYQPKAKQ